MHPHCGNEICMDRRVLFAVLITHVSKIRRVEFSYSTVQQQRSLLLDVQRGFQICHANNVKFLQILTVK